MIRSLRKGLTTVELRYKYGSETISAEQTEIELMQDHAIFRTKLKPVDNNQKEDADTVFNNVDSITNIIIYDDQQISDKLSKFLSAYNQVKNVKLEITYQVKHIFSASMEFIDNDGLLFTIKR